MLEGRKRNREKGSKGHSLKSISSMCFLTAQPKLEFFVYLFIYLFGVIVCHCVAIVVICFVRCKWTRSYCAFPEPHVVSPG